MMPRGERPLPLTASSALNTPVAAGWPLSAGSALSSVPFLSAASSLSVTPAWPLSMARLARKAPPSALPSLVLRLSPLSEMSMSAVAASSTRPWPRCSRSAAMRTLPVRGPSVEKSIASSPQSDAAGAGGASAVRSEGGGTSRARRAGSDTSRLLTRRSTRLPSLARASVPPKSKLRSPSWAVADFSLSRLVLPDSVATASRRLPLVAADGFKPNSRMARAASAAFSAKSPSSATSSLPMESVPE